ncbi:hypothetical protein AN958_07081, partial [Leucoagaricus sp. SymC.cos]
LGSMKKHLRLVCTQLSLALEPLVLSHVVINVTQPRLSTVNSQLQLLASDRHRATSFIRELSIRSLAFTRPTQPTTAQMEFVEGRWSAIHRRERDDTPQDQRGESVMKGHLEAAIANMVNLQVVRLNVNSGDSAWATLAVINGLAECNSLSYLNLYLAFDFDISTLRLDLLPGLKRIVITACESLPQFMVKRLGKCIAHSPEMTSIDIDRSLCHGDTDVPSLHDLLGNVSLLCLEHLGLNSWYTRFDNTTLPHLRFLKSLTLLNNRIPPRDGHPFSSTSAEIWSALRTSQIHLERITTDAMDASLVEYLASYSGLIRLYLRNINAPDHQSSDQLAELFFDSALPSHSSTLTDLHVLPHYEGKWCFGDHITPSIIRCTKLQYLKVAVISSQVHPLQDGDIITIIISMAARYLRSLKNLGITTAQAEWLRSSQRAGASKKHFSSANDKIARAITACIPDPTYQAHLPPVSANLIKYVPRARCGPEVDGTRSRIRYLRLR